MSVGPQAFELGILINTETDLMRTFRSDLENKNLLPTASHEVQVRVVYPVDTDIGVLYGEAKDAFYEAKERMTAMLRGASSIGMDLNIFHPAERTLLATNGGAHYAVKLQEEAVLQDLRSDLSKIFRDHTGSSFGNRKYLGNLVVADAICARGSRSRTPERGTSRVKIPGDFHAYSVQNTNGVTKEFPVSGYAGTTMETPIIAIH